MRRISAALITYNEEDKVEEALASLEGVCDEIVVVDSFSSDATPEICRRYTDSLIQLPWKGYAKQKQFATDQASHDWVLSLDADEQLSPELREEIAAWKQRDDPPPDGYLIPRMSFFLGRWIKHTSWYPDLQLRLFRKSKGHWTVRRVHESFLIEGKAGRLAGHIHHFTYSTITEYLRQLDNFSSLAAADYADRGKRARLAHITLYPMVVFLKSYLLRSGFRDGVPGLVVSAFDGVSVFFKYLKLWDLQRCNPSCRRVGDE